MIQRVLSIFREFPIQYQGILIPIFGTFRLQHTQEIRDMMSEVFLSLLKNLEVMHE